MKRIIWRTSSTLFWCLVGIYALCILAVAVGLARPLAVSSPSMQPLFTEADAIVDTPVATSSLRVGDVVTVRSERTQGYVTHRIVSIEQTASGQYAAVLKGDDNEIKDSETYVLGDSTLKLAVALPGGASVLERVSDIRFNIALASVVFGVLILGVIRRRESESADKEDIKAPLIPAPSNQ